MHKPWRNFLQSSNLTDSNLSQCSWHTAWLNPHSRSRVRHSLLKKAFPLSTKCYWNQVLFSIRTRTRGKNLLFTKYCQLMMLMSRSFTPTPSSNVRMKKSEKSGSEAIALQKDIGIAPNKQPKHF